MGDVQTALKRQYLSYLQEGMTRSRAAVEVGMTNMGIDEAMRNDRLFREDVQQILDIMTDDVEQAMYVSAVKGSVEAQKFWLVNRSEDRWANRSRVEHTGRNGGPIELATQATVALRTVLMDRDTRELAVDYIDAELAPPHTLELEAGDPAA